MIRDSKCRASFSDAGLPDLQLHDLALTLPRRIHLQAGTRTEVLGKETNITELKDPLASIEAKAFIYLAERGPSKNFTYRMLEATRWDPTMVLLRSCYEDDGIVGYSVAIQAGYVQDCSVRENIPVVCSTALLPDYHAAGLSRKILAALDSALKDKGYSIASRNCMIENNWAKKVESFLGDRIVSKHKHPSRYGDQVSFLYRLE